MYPLSPEFATLFPRRAAFLVSMLAKSITTTAAANVTTITAIIDHLSESLARRCFAGVSCQLTEAVVLARSYERMKESTSSRFSSINFSVVASRLSRSIGSVFDPRTLKCQSGNSAEIPSSV
jgi:hypothetical protein